MMRTHAMDVRMWLAVHASSVWVTPVSGKAVFVHGYMTRMSIPREMMMAVARHGHTIWCIVAHRRCVRLTKFSLMMPIFNAEIMLKQIDHD